MESTKKETFIRGPTWHAVSESGCGAYTQEFNPIHPIVPV